MLAVRDKRSKATKKSLKGGKANEHYINYIFKKFSKKTGIKYKWWREEGYQYQEGYDFTFYWPNGKPRYHIECERKSGADYERFFHPDWDFLPENDGLVQLVFKKPNVVVKEPVYYFMTITVDEKTMVAKYILWEDMKNIKEYDKKVRIYTKRDLNKKESFYRYPFNKFKIINPITKELP